MFYLHEIIQTISHNKLRTALTGLAVSWGIFMLIILVGMSNGLMNDFKQRASSNTSNNIMLGGGYTTKAYKGYAEGREIQLRNSDAGAIAERSGGHIADTYTSITSDATISSDTEYISEGYQGVSPGAQDAERITVKSGRFINDLDMSERRKVMVISTRSAERLFPEVDNPVGLNVSCSGLTFKIIGVYDDRWRTTVFIPYTTARMLAGDSDEVATIIGRLRDVSTTEQGEAVEKSVINTLAGRHDFDPEDSGAVWTWNQFLQNQRISSNMSLMSMVTWIIGMLTLLSGIIGVSNIMFVSVRERTHEIGIRRAIGARPHQIVFQIILESVAITAMFGYAGIVVGVAFLQLIATVMSQNPAFPTPSIDIAIAFYVTLLLVVAGVLAGLFPALKALKVKPVEALRTE